jgi:hypothetical protein
VLQDLEVDRVVAELAAGELPVEHAALQVAVRGLLDQVVDLGSPAAVADRLVGEQGEGNGEGDPDDRASHQEIDPELPGVELPELRRPDRQGAAAAEPPADLDLSEDEQRPESGQADVGGQVGEAAVEAQQAGKDHAEGQVEAVEGRAADEHPEAHRPGLAPGRVTLGAEPVEQLP